ncbi:LysR family transcriptional regulator [Agromyces sp. NPDC058484]|uniref:LysR family transcriptional regulator n=1 Tax=Agromyces sp. NPDC058484 TaxID=3346524 RepID=UPI0036609771
MARFGHRQLEYFIAVANAGSFRRAAEALYISQPSLSTQIGAMERELGAALFYRHARGVNLTPVGRVLLREALTTVAAADRAYRLARLAADGSTGDLKFATITSIAAGLVPRALERWRINRPGALVSMTEFRNPIALEQSVRDGQFDFAIGPKPGTTFAYMQSLGAEEFVVLLPREDPLLKEKQVSLAMLSKRRWVLFTPDNGIFRVHESIFARENLIIEGAAFTSQTDAAVNLAAAGLGPTIVPSNAVPEHLKPNLRPFHNRYLREVFAYAPDSLDPFSGSFVTELGTVVAEDATVGAD